MLSSYTAASAWYYDDGNLYQSPVTARVPLDWDSDRVCVCREAVGHSCGMWVENAPLSRSSISAFKFSTALAGIQTPHS